MSDLLESQESYEIIKKNDPEIIIRLLEASNQEQKSRAEEAESKFKKLEAQFESETKSYKAQIEQLNIQINTLKAGGEHGAWEVIDDNSLTLFQHEKLIQELKASLKEKENELSTLKGALGLEQQNVSQIFMESAATEVGIENKKLKEQLAALQHELDNSKKIIKAFQAEIKSLTTQQEDQTKQQQKLLAKFEDQKSQLEAKHNALRDAGEKQKATYENMILKYQAQNQELRDELNALQNELKSALTEVLKLKKQNNELSSNQEAEKLKEGLQKLETENSSLKHENEKLLQLLKGADLPEDKADKLRMTDLEREIGVLIKQLAEGLSENENLKDQIEKLKSENKSLIEFCEQEFKNKDLKELNLGKAQEKRENNQNADAKTKIVKLFKEFFQ